jgi:hypothetical protein
MSEVAASGPPRPIVGMPPWPRNWCSATGKIFRSAANQQLSPTISPWTGRVRDKGSFPHLGARLREVQQGVDNAPIPVGRGDKPKAA